MNKVLILITMFFLHIVDDYYLQGVLAKMKQKSWWEENTHNNDFYKNDYKVALIEHAFSWSFVISLPYAFIMIKSGDYGYLTPYIICLVFNVVVHTFADNLKANRKYINLVADQLCHVIQIVATWTLMNLWKV